jgi:hypothetical protein
MFGWFSKKKENEGIKEETKRGFEAVKKDIFSINDIVKKLDSETGLNKRDLAELREDLSTVKEQLEELRNMFSVMNEIKLQQPQTRKQLLVKQTAVYPVQTGVQTGVQTPNLDTFSVTERAIIWVLLNTDMKLSYEDISAILGKEKSTIRGQINAIKQKSEGLLEDLVENNGKKRVFIPEEIKEKMLKKSKVRVKKDKKDDEIDKSI